mgnify:CR=1 FL=1
MRIVEEKKYTMYLSEEEFDLLYPITKSIPYGYRCITNNNDDIVEYVLTLKDNMLDDITEMLHDAASYAKYEEYNIFRAEEITRLSDAIYINLHYWCDDDEDLDFTKPFELFDPVDTWKRKVLDDYEVVEEYTGKDLEYLEYEQYMDYLKVNKKAFFVTCADYVTMEDGTGIVHIAPAFGQDDYEVGLKYDLPVLNPVDENGCYTDGPWKGRLVVDSELELDIIK